MRYSVEQWWSSSTHSSLKYVLGGPKIEHTKTRYAIKYKTVSTYVHPLAFGEPRQDITVVFAQNAVQSRAVVVFENRFVVVKQGQVRADLHLERVVGARVLCGRRGCVWVGGCVGGWVCVCEGANAEVF
jgi:hypothetical protein